MNSSGTLLSSPDTSGANRPIPSTQDTKPGRLEFETSLGQECLKIKPKRHGHGAQGYSTFLAGARFGALELQIKAKHWA